MYRLETTRALKKALRGLATNTLPRGSKHFTTKSAKNAEITMEFPHQFQAFFKDPTPLQVSIKLTATIEPKDPAQRTALNTTTLIARTKVKLKGGAKNAYFGPDGAWKIAHKLLDAGESLGEHISDVGGSKAIESRSWWVNPPDEEGNGDDNGKA